MRVDIDALTADLADADDLFACAAVSCRHLHGLGYDLLSVYFERSGRLRCYGSHGYWQVLDGFTPSVGVIGETVRSGVARVVDTTCSDLYMEAAPSVVSEVCVPVFVDGRSLGALNIESDRPLPIGTLDEAEAVAVCLAERIRELGGLPELEGWRLIADRATRLQTMRDPRDVTQMALQVALTVSGNRSGLVALGSSTTGVVVEHVTGPLSGALRDLTSTCLEHIGRWVEGPLSCYTVGEPDGQGFTGQDSLRTVGVEALSVFAIAAGAEHLGYLLLADEQPGLPDPEVVEQLELFATMVASAITNARYVARLLDQSTRDPLTGLGHSRAFGDRLRAIEHGPSELHAVLSIDVDHFKRINDTHGHTAGDQVLRALAQSMSASMRGADCIFRTGGDEFAAVVAVADENEALVVARRLREAAQFVGIEVSIGVALTHPGSDDSESVFSRADAALYHVKRTGRGAAHLSSDKVPVPAVGD